MMHKLTVATYPDLTSFQSGSGFYEVFQQSDGTSWLYYFNITTNMYYMLEDINVVPREVLESLRGKQEEKQEEMEKPIPALEGMVSETFALKAMAIAKANTQTIKMSDIL